MLTDAIKRGASDIHIEPYEKEYRVRYRIDGILYEMMHPPLKLKEAITSRCKIMARLDIAEKRLPQDGRIKIKTKISGKSKDLDYRVSFAMAAKAPPITRMRIGVERPPAPAPSTRERLVAVDHDVAVCVDLRLESGGITVDRVVLLDDRRPDQPVAGVQEIARRTASTAVLLHRRPRTPPRAPASFAPDGSSAPGLELRRCSSGAARCRRRDVDHLDVSRSGARIRARARLGTSPRAPSTQESLTPPAGTSVRTSVALAGVAAVGEPADEALSATRRPRAGQPLRDSSSNLREAVRVEALERMPFRGDELVPRSVASARWPR